MVLFLLNLFKSSNSQGYVLCFDLPGLLLLIHIIQLATEVFAPKCCFYILKVWIPLLLFLCTIHFSVESYALTDTELSHLGRLSNLQYLQLAGLPGTWYKSIYHLPIGRDTQSNTIYCIYTVYTEFITHSTHLWDEASSMLFCRNRIYYTYTLQKSIYFFLKKGKILPLEILINCLKLPNTKRNE